MKKEYDFPKAERGRFYRKGAKLRLPIYLDAKLQNQVEDLANLTGRGVGDVVNRIVEKEVRLIDELDSHKETKQVDAAMIANSPYLTSGRRASTSERLSRQKRKSSFCLPLNRAAVRGVFRLRTAISM